MKTVILMNQVGASQISVLNESETHSTSTSPKMVEKVITTLDSSKVSHLDCIPMVVHKNFEPLLKSSNKTFGKVWHAGFPQKLKFMECLFIFQVGKTQLVSHMLIML